MSKFKIGDRVHYDDRLTKGVGTIHLRAPENEGFDWGVAVAEHDRMRAYHNGNVRWFLARDLRPALTIEPGRHYRTRSGKPTGRVSKGDTGFEAVVDGHVRIFDKAGGAVHGDDDIVEDWVPKVGERVRYAAHYNSPARGTDATVVEVVDDTYVMVDTHRWTGVCTEILSDLEPLPVAPQPAANVGAQVDTLTEEYGPAPASNDNAAAEPDTTLNIKFTSDFSDLDAAILVRKKKLKKLIKLARKAGIDLREAA